ncbi:Tigger transposable element-derived protein 6 [Dictyocoela muelleri]|nr:Tigger transposable element-derived protein 6 [Dictyocoela muelleri]
MKIKRCRFSLEEKIEIIKYAESNQKTSHTRIAEIFSERFNKKISRRSIFDFIKNKNFILKAFLNNSDRKNILSVRKYEEIEKQLFQWLSYLEAKGCVYNEEIIRSKALNIAENLKIKNFHASNGWIQKFKKRHGISSKSLTGESLFVKRENFEEFSKHLHEKMRDYRPEDIFNCDETALFYKIMPSKSLVSKVRHGSKLHRDRISILLCVNSTGTEKIKPLVIGKFNKPRCFKNFKYNDMINYEFNNSAWMTSEIFTQWLFNLSNEMERQKRKILLILDNCPSHKVSKTLKNIELVYLPKNATSIFQPLDCKIIRSFKSKYYKNQLSDVLIKLDEYPSVEEIYKKITLKDAIIFIYWAWKDIKSTCISKCWKKALGLANEKNDDGDMDNLKEYINSLNIIDPIEPQEILDNFDNNIENDIFKFEADLKFSTQKSDVTIDHFNNSNAQFDMTDVEVLEREEAKENIQNEISEEGKNISFSDVLKSYEVLKSFILSDCDDEKILNSIHNLHDFLSKKKIKSKQMKISDFLSKK